MKLYWAYGSNLNVATMRRRCPSAKKVGPLVLKDSALVFRGVADVEHRKRSKTPGGLWRITQECERRLDAFEGARAGGLYHKIYILLSVDGQEEQCLLYQMNEDRYMWKEREGIMPPGQDYLTTILRGYADFGLDEKYLKRAVRHSWEFKCPTPVLRERHRRRGQLLAPANALD